MDLKRRLLALGLVLVMALAACGSPADPDPSESPSPSVAPTLEPSPEPSVEPTAIPDEKVNPLTGLPLTGEVTAHQRPVAVMLNNIKVALPQQGNSQADILYEVLAEGGITRMLGVYQSMEGVGEVGSVRSARPYYLELALGLDAVYLHAGGSEAAYENIKKWNVTALDCVRTTAYSGIFWRDAQRRKNNGFEHSVLTSGEAILEHFPDYSFRKDHEEGYSLPYTFVEDGTPAGGSDANVIRVPFSNYKTGVFTYNAETKKYLVEEYGKPFVDGNTGEQLAMTNVVVIRTSCKAIDDYGRMRVDLSGYNGDGWFACGGKLVPIRWSKAERTDPILYTLEDGTPLTFGQGNSYINIIPLSNEITVE